MNNQIQNTANVTPNGERLDTNIKVRCKVNIPTLATLIQHHAVYKGCTITIKTQIESKKKKGMYSNIKPKKAGLAILISSKIHLKTKNFTRDKEEHFMMIKVSIIEENITIINESFKFMKQKMAEQKKELKKYTIIV